jgi:hypothetical protein
MKGGREKLEDEKLIRGKTALRRDETDERAGADRFNNLQNGQRNQSRLRYAKSLAENRRNSKFPVSWMDNPNRGFFVSII